MGWPQHLEAALLLVSGSLALAAVAPGRDKSVTQRRLRYATVFALLFVAVFVIKTVFGERVLYPREGRFRLVYLGLLAIHATSVPAAFALGLRSRFWRPSALVWSVAAGAGIAAYALLFLAGARLN